ncbi:hypothetical protein GJ496_011330 [Pomphorhynchus laevis]|nr:hypothetical protein GJ496_011330 [Pomphorhynchus laevis]
MEGCGKVSQVTLIIINCITALLALVGAGLGIWIKYDSNVNVTVSVIAASYNAQEVKTLMTHLLVSSNLWILCGCIAFVLSIIGCMGAWKESKVFLSLYATLMGLLIIIELGIIIALVSFKGKFENQLEKSLTKGFESKHHYILHHENSTAVNRKGKLSSTAFTLIEQNFKCCGLKGPADYGPAKLVPHSCYSKEHRIYPYGCVEQVNTFRKKYTPSIITLQIVLICVESVGFMLALTTCLWPEESKIIK